MPAAIAITRETQASDSITAFAHMFQAPMAFASGGADAQAGLEVSIQLPSSGAFFSAGRQPSRGGAAEHSPSFGRG